MECATEKNNSGIFGNWWESLHELIEIFDGEHLSIYDGNDYLTIVIEAFLWGIYGNLMFNGWLLKVFVCGIKLVTTIKSAIRCLHRSRGQRGK